MTITTNADNDLKLPPVLRARLQKQDNDTQRIKDRVDKARLKSLKNPNQSDGELFLMDAPQKPRDGSDVMDGIVASESLLKRTDFSTATDPVLPILKAIPNPGWWWTGRNQYVMTTAMWDAYLSGHWCMRCRHALPERHAEACEACMFTRKGAENAVKTLELMREVLYEKASGLAKVPAGALKGLKPINTNTRGAA